MSPRLHAVALIALFAAATSHAQTTAPAPQMPFRISDGQVIAFLQMLPPESAKSIGSLINGLISDTTSHMRMAPRRAASKADTSRASGVVRTMHDSLAKYADVNVALREGYVRFLPWLEDQPVYHYNNDRNARSASRAFDAAKPTSLLYKKDAAGKMILVGAMYTAPATLTNDELDARLPLGFAYWHQHVNFCARRPTDEELKLGRPDSARVAKSLELDTQEACTAAGGMFVPQLFGWMAHVNAFEGTDDETVWGGDSKDHMNGHSHGHHP